MSAKGSGAGAAAAQGEGSEGLAASAFEWLSDAASDALEAVLDGRAWGWTHWTLGWVAVVAAATYFIPLLYSWWFCWEQDLKKKYNAKWAIVTGGSSGIGRAVVDKLAKQGLNVVIAAMPDELLTNTQKEVSEAYPDQEIVAVPVDLSRDGYMEAIRAATDGCDVQIVFLNAGFVRTGLFAGSPVGAALANFNVNATSGMVMAHHFLTEMRNKGLKGCLCFTSSPAYHIPTPITAMYGPTKAFLTSFAMALAAEARADGIDVCVVHPSPTRTAFYDGNKHNIGAMNFAQKLATGPETIANAFFSAVGRIVVRDQGTQAVFYRLLSKVLDNVFLTEVMARFAILSGEFKAVIEAGKPKKRDAKPSTSTRRRSRSRVSSPRPKAE